MEKKKLTPVFKILLTSRAAREYKKLHHSVSRDIDDVFEGEFHRNPLSRILDIKKLRLPFPGYRLRIGDYRVLFTLEKDTITIYSIKHRREAYK